MKYGVWCEVWGGVTGHRESWLKDNGVVQQFDTIEEAQKMADEMKSIRIGPYSTTNYSYSAREMRNGY